MSDPFLAEGQATEAKGGMDEGRGWRMDGFKSLLDRQAETPLPKTDSFRCVEYYTLGEKPLEDNTAMAATRNVDAALLLC